ncbi:MAG: GTP-binding protein Der [candidate division Zixibacteria bacterium SM23_73_2]|nr:MAG: GTP-binding protein Der [candidate division Zixibacteria bacterium SM23_73_2]
MQKPIVAIIGRPNVGKSTLFNRLIRKKMAVVDKTPGVTRDRNYAECSWAGKDFFLVDTGGFIPKTKDQLEKKVLAQVETAIYEADLVLFLVDNKVGIQIIEQDIAKRLRKVGKKIILVANKVDNQKEEQEIFGFKRLGLGDPIAVSAASGRNTGELLDKISDFLPEVKIEEEEKEGIKIAVLGRPNVGKSSLVNAILGEEKLIVTDLPGTTRDSIDTKIQINDKTFTLIDTAGLKRKSRIKEDLDFYTSLRTLRSIQRCDVALVLIEAQEGLLSQDLKIFEEVEKARKGMVMVVNKWDLVEKESTTADFYTKAIQKKAPSLDYIPIIYISAKTKKRLNQTLNLALKVYDERKRRIQTSELNDKMKTEIERRPPAQKMGKYIKIYYVTQTGVEPPTFVFFCNYPEFLQKNYLRFLENRLREHFGYQGVPLRIKVRKRE